MKTGGWRAGALLPILAALAAPALAQDDRMTPIATPSQQDAIALGTGALPNAPIGESWHRQYGSRFARNVTQATLTPFLPDPARATGAAVIVAPGGGFRTLSMDNEGYDVARALAADDPFFGNGGFGLIESWRAAKRPVEFHLFEQGGHGFGMYPKPTTSTGWFEAFARWLRMHGWAKDIG